MRVTSVDVEVISLALRKMWDDVVEQGKKKFLQDMYSPANPTSYQRMSLYRGSQVAQQRVYTFCSDFFVCPFDGLFVC